MPNVCNFNIPLLINASGEVTVYSEDVSGDFFSVDYVLDVSNATLSAANMCNTFYYTDAHPDTPEQLFAVDVEANDDGDSSELTDVLCKQNSVIESLFNDSMEGGTELGGGKLHLQHSSVPEWAPQHTNAAGQKPFGHGGNTKIATGDNAVNLGELMVRYLSAVLLGDYRNQAVLKGENSGVDSIVKQINNELNMKEQLVKIFMTDNDGTLMEEYIAGTLEVGPGSIGHLASTNMALMSIWEFMKASGRHSEDPSGTLDSFTKFDFRKGDTLSLYIEVKLDLVSTSPVTTHTNDEHRPANGNNANINFKTLFLSGLTTTEQDNFMVSGTKMTSKIWKIRWTLQ